MKLPQLTYRDFLEKAKIYDDCSLPNSIDVLQCFFPSSLYLTFRPSAIYIIDYVNFKYLHVDSELNILSGYPASLLLEAGPDFFISRIHPNDFEIINKHAFPIGIDYIFNHNTSPLSNISFTITYRLKNNLGNYLQVSQRSSFICSSYDNIPLAAIGSITDITPFKTDLRVLHIIEDLNVLVPKDQRDFIITYYPTDKKAELSKREIDILKWVCDGCSSKLIADKLNLSIHTVNNHRKNMLQKTNSKNISELLNHSLKNGIL